MDELVYSKMLETGAEAIIIRQPIRSCPPEGPDSGCPKRNQAREVGCQCAVASNVDYRPRVHLP